MVRRPPRSTRTDTLFPYPTLFRSRRDGSMRFEGDAHDKALVVGAALQGGLQIARLSGAHRFRHLLNQLEFELTGNKPQRSEEHTSELQSLMRISYAVFCLKKKK